VLLAIERPLQQMLGGRRHRRGGSSCGRHRGIVVVAGRSVPLPPGFLQRSTV
jgi:hypothetical protein